MMKAKRTAAVLGLGLLYSLLPNAIAQTNSDDVQVTLSVDVVSDIEVGFSNDITLATIETIYEDDRDNDGNPDGFNEYYTGFATGCVHILGVANVDIKVTGANTAPGVVGPLLRAIHDSTDYYLYYQPTLGFGPANTNFSTLAASLRDGDVAGTGVANVYGNFDGANHTNGHTVTQFSVLNAFGGSTESGCASGDNAALAVLVGIDGGGHEGDDANNIFGDVNRFVEVSNLPDGSYQFNDTITVEITPNLG